MPLNINIIIIVQISAYPGESFQVNVSVKDELGEQVAAPLRVLETQSSLVREIIIVKRINNLYRIAQTSYCNQLYHSTLMNQSCL